jgi:nucleoside-diphosphate-sugar epimerase
MARILIAGCGDLGTTLGCKLYTAGHQVWGLKRQPQNLPAGIAPLTANLTHPHTLTHLPDALDFVVYSVAATGFNENAYQEAYVTGVENLLHALTKGSPALQRVLFVSSTSVYSQHRGEWVDETSPATADNFSGRCMRAGEHLIATSPWPGVVIRFGGIYGPGRTRLIESVRNGSATRPHGDPIYTNRIHRDDCVRVLEHLLNLPNPAPVYIAVDDQPVPLAEVLSWLALQVGMPEPPLAWESPLKPGAERDGNEVLRHRASKRCSNARLRASGFQFSYPSYREGYAALLAAMT